MKNYIRLTFAVLMLSVFVCNSILEVALARQEAAMELASEYEKNSKEEEKDKEEKNSKEEKEDKEEKNSKEEKEDKEEKNSKEEKDSNQFIDTPIQLTERVKHICMPIILSAYQYADNLPQFSPTLETPPPEHSRC